MTTRSGQYALLEAMPIGTLVHDERGQLVYANAVALEELTGIAIPLSSQEHVDRMASVGEALARLTRFGTDPEPKAWPWEPQTSAFESSEVALPIVAQLERTDGTPRWFSIHCRRSVGQDGVWSVVSTLTDVTEREQEKLQIEDRHTQLQDIIDALPGIMVYQTVVAADGTSQMVYLSAAADAMFGIAPQAAPIPSERFVALIHDADRKRVVDGRSQRVDDDFVDLEFRAHREGELGYRWFNLRTRAKRASNSYAWTGILTDVDARRRAEEEAMRRVQKLEAIGRLAAGVVHNFNNLLSAIGPNVEVALDLATPELVPMLEDAKEASLEAGELAQQLMRMVRNEAKLPMRSVNLAAVVHRILRICKSTFRNRIPMVAHGLETPVCVHGDASALGQALLNLCLNAKDAVELVQAPQIEIRLSKEDAYAVLEVADNGHGMPSDVQTRIGEPFFTTKGEDRGTGLGMLTVFSIVRDHDGRVTFRSEVGRGTRFRLEFPLKGA